MDKDLDNNSIEYAESASAGSQSGLYNQTSPQQQQARELLVELYRDSPLPIDHQLVNLGLYQRSTGVAKLLYLDELYRRILNIPGVIMEFGFWHGETLVRLFNLRAVYEPYNHTRKVIGFDTLTGYTGPTSKDGTDELVKDGQYSVPIDYESYLERLLTYHEQENILSHIPKFELVVGDASLTIHTYLEQHPETIIALAYFDMQLYEPTKACLEAILPHLIKGSVIAMDELNCPEFPGETTAIREALGLTKYPIHKSRFLPSRSFIVIE